MAYAKKRDEKRVQAECQRNRLEKTRAAKAAAKRPMPCPFEAMAAAVDAGDDEARFALAGVM